MKTFHLALFLSLALFASISLYKPLMASAEYFVFPTPESHPQVILQGGVKGRTWAYLVPFDVVNSSTIESLISCESQGVNISRPDSNGLTSDGVLQFNRGVGNILGSGTWADMEKRFDYYGSPINPPDAIHMADLMISAGFLKRWTCAKIMHLL